MISRHLIVDEELCVGDRLRLTWHPGRVCDVEYLGGSQFKVLESQNTRTISARRACSTRLISAKRKQA